MTPVPIVSVITAFNPTILNQTRNCQFMNLVKAIKPCLTFLKLEGYFRGYFLAMAKGILLHNSFSSAAACIDQALVKKARSFPKHYQMILTIYLDIEGSVIMNLLSHLLPTYYHSSSCSASSSCCEWIHRSLSLSA